jgi:hypothetical protein
VIGMLVRFGIFLGWLFNAAALICAAPAVLMYINQRGPMSDGDTCGSLAFLGIAGAVWLFGRGVRYVFVGPTYAPGPAKDFAERFADPNVPVRLPPNPPASDRLGAKE